MSVFSTAPPKFSILEAEILLKDLYGLTADISPLISERDQNFLCNTASKQFILKISNPDDEIQSYLGSIWNVMEESVYNGCHSSGELPGGPHVQRRASTLNNDLLSGKSYVTKSEWLSLLKNEPRHMDTVTNWVSCFALAVNEVNASYGRIVTALTNGSAGVIPAVIMYLLYFHDEISQQYIRQFLLVSSEIGMLFKKGATISAAAGGCQAEIGVSSAMAAGALTFSIGGNIRQILMAAEIAMEHHLGLTCDPIGGLVQKEILWGQ